MFTPNQYFQLETALPSEEVLQLLVDNTAENFLSFIKPNKEFQGEIEKNSFKIKKVLKSRNSFNPLIIGSMKVIDHQRTVIEYQLISPTFVKLFSIFWFIFMMIFFITAIIIAHPIAIGFSLLILLFGLLVFYILPLLVKNTITKTFENLFHTNVIPRKKIG